MMASTVRYTVTVAAIVILALGALGAVIGLVLANRPVSTVAELFTAILIPTITSLLGLAKTAQLRDEVHNGVQDSIAAKTAELVASEVAKPS